MGASQNPPTPIASKPVRSAWLPFNAENDGEVPTDSTNLSSDDAFGSADLVSSKSILVSRDISSGRRRIHFPERMAQMDDRERGYHLEKQS